MGDIYSAILQEICDREKRPFVIAIDGRCASGKTTLAGRLQKEIDCNIIHMDHFFSETGAAHRGTAAGAGR